MQKQVKWFTKSKTGKGAYWLRTTKFVQKSGGNKNK